ncbi:MAG: hypothetical protein ACD_60C00090G0015 [uncultured bacterium]|nr:MAG: hypothetical protein ACD_60C00090G0015 [uncultured bacterium]
MSISRLPSQISGQLACCAPAIWEKTKTASEDSDKKNFKNTLNTFVNSAMQNKSVKFYFKSVLDELVKKSAVISPFTLLPVDWFWNEIISVPLPANVPLDPKNETRIIFNFLEKFPQRRPYLIAQIAKRLQMQENTYSLLEKARDELKKFSKESLSREIQEIISSHRKKEALSHLTEDDSDEETDYIPVSKPHPTIEGRGYTLCTKTCSEELILRKKERPVILKEKSFYDFIARLTNDKDLYAMTMSASSSEKITSVLCDRIALFSFPSEWEEKISAIDKKDQARFKLWLFCETALSSRPKNNKKNLTSTSSINSSLNTTISSASGSVITQETIAGQSCVLHSQYVTDERNTKSLPPQRSAPETRHPAKKSSNKFFLDQSRYSGITRIINRGGKFLYAVGKEFFGFNNTQSTSRTSQGDQHQATNGRAALKK